MEEIKKYELTDEAKAFGDAKVCNETLVQGERR